MTGEMRRAVEIIEMLIECMDGLCHPGGEYADGCGYCEDVEKARAFVAEHKGGEALCK